jgi:two-component system sensor histidine kinase KdpD
VASDLPEVPMDADAIGQALANLIDNAIKYSGDERALTVDARMVDDRLVLSVTDRDWDPAEEQAKIFEKFYRVGRSDTQGRAAAASAGARAAHRRGSRRRRQRGEHAGVGSRFALRVPLGRA